MPGRTYYNNSVEKYSYGFNGKENVDEVASDGDYIDFGARIYDSRLGRWMSVDPLQYKYPSVSSYCFSLNSIIAFKDPDGREVILVTVKNETKALLFSWRFFLVSIFGDASLAMSAARCLAKLIICVRSPSFEIKL